MTHARTDGTQQWAYKKKPLYRFKGDKLQEMELHDNFGHMTVIEFSKLEPNAKLPTQAFRFVPPAGADVVGE